MLYYVQVLDFHIYIQSLTYPSMLPFAVMYIPCGYLTFDFIFTCVTLLFTQLIPLLYSRGSFYSLSVPHTRFASIDFTRFFPSSGIMVIFYYPARV